MLLLSLSFLSSSSSPLQSSLLFLLSLTWNLPTSHLAFSFASFPFTFYFSERSFLHPFDWWNSEEKEQRVNDNCSHCGILTMYNYMVRFYHKYLYIQVWQLLPNFIFYFFCKLIILISFNCFLIKFDIGLEQTILSINDIIYYFFHLMLLKYFISSVYFIF